LEIKVLNVIDARCDHEVYCLNYSTRHYTAYVTTQQSGSQFTTCFFYVHLSTYSKNNNF